MRKLESDVKPMQESISELSEKSGVLQAEKKLLEEDIKRWKARTQVRSVCILPERFRLCLKTIVDVINDNYWTILSSALQHLVSQQKDTDPEEYKRLHSEREVHIKRIQQLTEETGQLKKEASRLEPFLCVHG